MSVNAFFNAFNATQNALGDPRGDARKREQEDMKNAMLQREMQMKEYDYSQKQSEAQRLERERQLLATRGTNRAGFIRGAMFPNRGPAQAVSAAPAIPMTGGAPIQQAQGQAFTDAETGREGASYTATAMSRGAMPTEEEILDFEIEDAAIRGDDQFLNDRINLRRQRMTEEEKKGREQIALISGALSNLPDADLPGAVMQALQDLNIDLEATKLDDYVNDIPRLRRALRVQIALGSPEKAAEEAVKVQGSFDQFRPFERQDLGNRVGVFDPRTGQFSSGPSIGLSPNTAASTSAQVRTAQIGANSRIEAARIRKDGDEEEEQGQLGEIGPWTQYQQPPAQGQPR
jgi:hypothetical protein